MSGLFKVLLLHVLSKKMASNLSFPVSSVILYLHLTGPQRSHSGWCDCLEVPSGLSCFDVVPFMVVYGTGRFARGHKASGVTLNPFVSTSKGRLDLNEELCSRNKLFYLKVLSPNVDI